DCAHVFLCKRFSGYCEEIAKNIARVRRKRNRDLPSLDSPLDAYHCGMHAQPARDLTNCRILEGRRVFGRAVAFGPGGRSDGRKRNGLNAVLDQIPKELWLLEMGM